MTHITEDMVELRRLIENAVWSGTAAADMLARERALGLFDKYMFGLADGSQWIAPMEVTGEMLSAGGATGELDAGPALARDFAAMRVWSAMRDQYLTGKDVS